MEWFYCVTTTHNMPILDIGIMESRSSGQHRRIDFLRSEDLTHYCMRGVDKYGRPFLTLRVKVEEKDTVGTIYQRYDNEDINSIAFSTCLTNYCPIHWDCYIAGCDYDEVVNRINRLLRGETILHFDEEKICYIEEVRKQIERELLLVLYRDLVSVILLYI